MSSPIFHTVPLVTIHRIQINDYIRWHELEGTVLGFVPHDNGYVYSLWIHNPEHEWMNNFEWIITADESTALPRIKKEYREWEQTFTV